jgi:hypothetical protein
MTGLQKEAKKHLIRIANYFQRFADSPQEHWRIEYEVVAAIVALVSAKTDFLESDFESIASCANGIVGKGHANGSGWMEFEMHICIFFEAFGYDSDWNGSTGEFNFWKRSVSGKSRLED